MIKLSTAFLLSTFAITALSATGTSGYVEIKQLRFGGGYTKVVGETEFIDPSNCSGDGTNKNIGILVYETTDSYKEIVSTLLSAKVTGNPVQFWVNGCKNDSGTQYPNGTYVYIN